jgi:methylmalonyl-CoA mutase
MEEEDIPVLKVDNSQVLESQIEQLKKLKSQRNQAQVDTALANLTDAAKSGEGNLLELCVEAAKVKCTVGEMSYALEEVFGRHKADIQIIKGVYASGLKSGGKEVDKIESLINDFMSEHGRRPRILLAKMGQDGHDRGQKVIATAFADLGFDVDIGPLFQTPEESAKQAVENDVHLIGVSSLAAGHLSLVPDLRDALKELGREDIGIIVGGVIPPQDYDKLYELGALMIFGPGTVISEAAQKLLEKLLGK